MHGALRNAVAQDGLQQSRHGLCIARSRIERNAPGSGREHLGVATRSDGPHVVCAKAGGGAGARFGGRAQRSVTGPGLVRDALNAVIAVKFLRAPLGDA